MVARYHRPPRGSWLKSQAREDRGANQQPVACRFASIDSLEQKAASSMRKSLLRRLMCNSEQRRRSPERMLHQALSNGWCRDGSGLLLGLIVRARRGLVEARPRFGATENRSTGSAQRSGGHHPGHPRPVAPLQKRARLLALRPGAPAPLLPEVVLPEPAQSAPPSPCARVAPLAACPRRGALGAFGGLPRVLDTTLIPVIVRVRAS